MSVSLSLREQSLFVILLEKENNRIQNIEKIKHRNKISNNKKVDKIITYSVHTKVSKWIVDSPLLFLAPLIQFIIRLYRKITALLSF